MSCDALSLEISMPRSFCQVNARAAWNTLLPGCWPCRHGRGHRAAHAQAAAGRLCTVHAPGAC